MSSSLPRQRLRVPLGVVAGVAVALIMACNNEDHEEDDTQFRKDVIWCEEAVAHLEDCCGTAFDSRQIECRHYYERNSGCGQVNETRIDPAYETGESECIRGQSCEAIRTNKICERALAAGKARMTRYESGNTNTSSSSSSSSVPVNVSSSSSSTSTSGNTSTTSSTSGSAVSGPICP